MKKRIAIIAAIVMLSSSAVAENCYVLVQDELNVRGQPSLGSTIRGRLFTGDQVEVTRRYKNWCFLEGLNSDEGNGWVSSNYLVSEPVTPHIGTPALVVANGRVAVRKSVDGERNSWVHPGDIVTIYGESETWSVTDRGYIKTEYLSQLN